MKIIMSRFNIIQFIALCSALAATTSASFLSGIQARAARHEYRRLCKNLLRTDGGIKQKPYLDLHYSRAQGQAAFKQALKPRSCPNFRDHINRPGELGMRSISPYGPIPDYDPSRYPRLIVHQACLCQYCFDPTTMTPDRNLASYNLTTSINVSYGEGKTEKYEVKTGCACVVPITHSMY